MPELQPEEETPMTPEGEVEEVVPAKEESDPESHPEEASLSPAADSPVAEEAEVEDDGRRKRQWGQARVEAALEALLFASPDVLGFRNMRRILPAETVSNEAMRAGLAQLKERYDRKESGIILVEISGGWQIQTREDFYPWVQDLAKTRNEEKITAAALETLAIIAYKQPITRAEIDAIRGVGTGQIIRTLMDKKMVKVVGRVELPGRPFQYGTTPHFLSHFGLKNLKDLPRGKDL